MTVNKQGLVRVTDPEAIALLGARMLVVARMGEGDGGTSLTHAQKGELNPAYLATHRFSLEDGPRGYDIFNYKPDGCVRAGFAP